MHNCHQPLVSQYLRSSGLKTRGGAPPQSGFPRWRSAPQPTTATYTVDRDNIDSASSNIYEIHVISSNEYRIPCPMKIQDSSLNRIDFSLIFFNRALSLRGERVELEREKILGGGVWRGFHTVALASSHRSTSKSRFVLREVLKKKTALVSKDQVLCLLQEEEKGVKVLCLTGLVERFVRASPPCCGSKRRVTIVFSAILGGEDPGSGCRKSRHMKNNCPNLKIPPIEEKGKYKSIEKISNDKKQKVSWADLASESSDKELDNESTTSFLTFPGDGRELLHVLFHSPGDGREPFSFLTLLYQIVESSPDKHFDPERVQVLEQLAFLPLHLLLQQLDLHGTMPEKRHFLANLSQLPTVGTQPKATLKIAWAMSATAWAGWAGTRIKRLDEMNQTRLRSLNSDINKSFKCLTSVEPSSFSDHRLMRTSVAPPTDTKLLSDHRLTPDFHRITDCLDFSQTNDWRWTSAVPPIGARLLPDHRLPKLLANDDPNSTVKASPATSFPVNLVQILPKHFQLDPELLQLRSLKEKYTWTVYKFREFICGPNRPLN
ncbi:hypothetical protein M5K25_008408 [Dendrobium thyrsiflorum]|uniref:Uncharacterized protein n=1 Tax=Dendrobium thyrsiflorum TaxID=117978 RepID=A0ABD0V8M3_DENTH